MVLMPTYVAIVEISEELCDLVPLLNMIGEENKYCALKWCDKFGLIGTYNYFSDGSDLDDFISRVKSSVITDNLTFVDSFADEAILGPVSVVSYGNLVMSNISIMHDNLGRVGLMDTITYARNCLNVIDARMKQAVSRHETVSWLRVRDRVMSSVASMTLSGV